MKLGILTKVFGTYSERQIKKITPLVDKILLLDEEYSKLSEDELKGKTQEFKDRLAKGETLDDILVEAFATVREASYRVLGMKHFPVQLIGGIVLHQGNIAEMKTGEGKTLVATLPAYLNALTGKGVYVVTVNDYLAKRDSEWMGKVYNYLGLSVGLIEPNTIEFEKRAAYNCDITYGTNTEFGFDYLRDNMVFSLSGKVQRGFNYCIIDEVDSILIDEARTPLIISGLGDDVSSLYKEADTFVRTLKGSYIKEEDKTSKLDSIIGIVGDEKYLDYDYLIDEKQKTVALTDKGIEKAEKYFKIDNLGDMENIEINSHILKALKAHSLFKRDVDYVVKGTEVLIVDEHTGRIMEGRRYSDGIHQAIETKEGVEIKKESKTLATITYQNFFRKFNKVSGMTGTAMTELEEFREIYNLDVIEIPTNKPIQRIDKTDKVYKTKQAKINAICDRIIECHEKGQPVLVGTTSVESSEELSDILTNLKIKHEVLNAKNHEKEAKIIAQAGHFGAVTIATNMAGRGTDIILGGNIEYKVKEQLKEEGYSDELIEQSTTYSETEDEEILAIRERYKELYEIKKKEAEPWVEKVKEVGGLYVIGTERHSSRRIDNQLRGRAGRQGDVGVSEFFISFDDDLMRIFGGDKVKGLFDKMDIPEDLPLDLPILSNAIESAQKKVESQHYAIRKQLLEYDTVMNLQRETVYETRDKILGSNNLRSSIIDMCRDYYTEKVEQNIIKPNHITLEDIENIKSSIRTIGLTIKDYTENELKGLTVKDIVEEVVDRFDKMYSELEKTSSEEFVRSYEKRVLLHLLDTNWENHLEIMDNLRQGIGLRVLGQKDPLVEYKIEGFEMFHNMMLVIREDYINLIMGLYRELVLEETIEVSSDTGQ